MAAVAGLGRVDATEVGDGRAGEIEDNGLGTLIRGLGTLNFGDEVF